MRRSELDYLQGLQTVVCILLLFFCWAKDLDGSDCFSGRGRKGKKVIMSVIVVGCCCLMVDDDDDGW